jgi:hypothetical protein
MIVARLPLNGHRRMVGGYLWNSNQRLTGNSIVFLSTMLLIIETGTGVRAFSGVSRQNQWPS